MKKTLILLAFSCVFWAVDAQKWIMPQRQYFEPYHDIRLGIGYKPFEAAYAAQNFLNFGMDRFYLPGKIDFNTKDYYSGTRYTTNAIFCEYIYQATKVFGVGATLTYFAYFNDYYNVVSDDKVGNNLIQHVSLYPTIRLSWINNPGFSMYSAFGIGPRQVLEINTINSVTTTSFRSSFGCQVTLLGFTIGKKLYCFSDFVTIGTQGVLTGGLGYRFSNHSK